MNILKGRVISSAIQNQPHKYKMFLLRIFYNWIELLSNSYDYFIPKGDGVWAGTILDDIDHKTMTIHKNEENCNRK